MKKFFKFLPIIFVLSACFCLAFSACGGKNDDKGDDVNVSGDAKKLIAYFSRADENYSVGVIEKGNTEILAEMIQEEMGGDLFHIERDTPYPSVYSDCTEVAQQEKNDNARPTLKETVDISEYDVIFLCYPIWYGDMPMCVYTFLESQDWNGKTVCPFSTNEGSGLAGTVATLKTKCAGASVSDGLSMRGSTAQNNRAEAKNLVTEWLEKIK